MTQKIWLTYLFLTCFLLAAPAARAQDYAWQPTHPLQLVFDYYTQSGIIPAQGDDAQICTKFTPLITQSFLSPDQDMFISQQNDLIKTWYLAKRDPRLLAVNTQAWEDMVRDEQTGYRLTPTSLLMTNHEILVQREQDSGMGTYYQYYRLPTRDSLPTLFDHDQTQPSSEYANREKLPQIFVYNNHDYIGYEADPKHYNFVLNQFIPAAPSQNICTWKVDTSAPMPAEIQNFLTTISLIMNDEVGGCSGSGHFHDLRRDASDQKVQDMLMRPWLLLAKTDQNSRTIDYSLRGLEVWAGQSLRARQITQDLARLYPLALKQLDTYYQAQFHVSVSESDRADILGAILQTYIYFLSSIKEWPEYAKPVDPLTPWASFTQNIQQITMVYPSKTNFMLNHAALPFLATILDQPDQLKAAIAQNHDINEKNLFDKTPLMFAAHSNQLEAVKILLDAGAKINERTTTYNAMEHQCMNDVDVSIGGRTALTYAAENASTELIAYLLAHGADTNVKDSDGKNISAYLALNTKIRVEEKSALLKQLQP